MPFAAPAGHANGAASTFYLAGSRSELVDPAGDRHITYQTPGGRVIKDAFVLSAGFGDVFNDTAQQNGVVDVASSQYDGTGRLILATLPEGGATGYAYSPDLEQNVIQVTRTPKPGSPLAPLVTSYAYDATYNKPTRITDPLGLVTTMSYDAATGNLVSTVADAGGSGHFNVTRRFTYNGVGQVLSATDPLGAVTRYAYDGFGNPVSIIRDAGAGRLNQTVVMGYSALGDVVSLTDPNGNFSPASATPTATPPATPMTGSTGSRRRPTRTAARKATATTPTPTPCRAKPGEATRSATPMTP